MNSVSWFSFCIALVSLILSSTASFASSNLQTAPLSRSDQSTANCQFLFKYYGLDPMFDTLPKEVRFIISSKLRDLFAGYFETEKHREMVREEEILAGTFSHDSSRFAYCQWSHKSAGKCILMDLSGEELVRKKIPKVNGYFTRMAFNPDDTRLALLDNRKKQNKIHEYRLTDFQASLCPIRLNSIDETLQQANALSSNAILDFMYCADGRLVVATNQSRVFILNKSRNFCDGTISIDKEIPCSDQSNSLKTSEASSDICLMSRFGSTALFITLPAKEHLSKEIVHCDYAHGSSRHLTQIDRLHKSTLSCDGTVLANINWFRNKKEEILSRVRIWNVLTEEPLTTFSTPEPVFELAITHNSDLLLLVGHDFWDMYHIPSGRHIAHGKLNLEKIDNSGRLSYLSSINNESSLFAVARTSFSASLLTFWKINPLWTQLDQMLKGKLQIDQVLFILFIRELKSKNLSLQQALPDLTKQFQHTAKEIKSSLAVTFEKYSEAEKQYIYCLLGTPNQDKVNAGEQ